MGTFNSKFCNILYAVHLVHTQFSAITLDWIELQK